jgi:hypothetical protein
MRRLARASALVVGVPLLAMLPLARPGSAQEASAPAEQTFNHSYWVAMWHIDRGDPRSPRLTVGEVIERIPARLKGVVQSLGSRMGGDFRPHHVALGLAVLVAWLVMLLRRRDTAEIAAGLMFLMLAGYFSFAMRLALPVYLLMMAGVVELVLLGLRRLLAEGVAQAGTAAFVLLACPIDLDPRARWPELEQQHREFQEVADYVRTKYPDTPLGASIGWHFGVYLDRPVASLQIGVKRDGIVSAYRTIARRKIGVVILNKGGGLQLRRQLTRRFGVEKHLAAADIVRIPDPQSLDPSAPGADPGGTAGPYQATGIKICEVDTESAIVWTRLTRRPERLGADRPLPLVRIEAPDPESGPETGP